MNMSGNVPSTLKVTHACGHSVTRAKSQREFLNEIFIEKAARCLCEACLAEHDRRRQEMIEASVQRTEEAAAATKLTGSKKQIEWANRIREKWLYVAKREVPLPFRESNFVKEKSAGLFPEFIEQAMTNVLAERLAAIDAVLAHTEAGWWIDFRGELDSLINGRTDKAIKSEFSRLPDR